jgi:predicted DNA-binding protein
MAKEKRMEVVTLRLKPSTKDWLKTLAEQDRRPFATYLAMILEDYADAKRRKADAVKERKKS